MNLNWRKRRFKANTQTVDLAGVGFMEGHARLKVRTKCVQIEVEAAVQSLMKRPVMVIVIDVLIANGANCYITIS
jgi:hypothetical protein